MLERLSDRYPPPVNSNGSDGGMASTYSSELQVCVNGSSFCGLKKFDRWGNVLLRDNCLSHGNGMQQ
jgi:hypothetical protein